jgi:hypothetical protein
LYEQCSIMKRILITRKSQRNKKREAELIHLLTLNESGFIIYPGKESEDERTGSPAQLLIDWYLYKSGKEKPLDFDIFVQYLKNL